MYDFFSNLLPNFFLVIVMCVCSVYFVYCLCVNVYCTAATGCQPVYCLYVNMSCIAATGFQPNYS
jgi:hypothetical protein